MWRTEILPLLEDLHYGEGVDVAAVYGLAALRAHLALNPPSPSAASFATPAPIGDVLTGRVAVAGHVVGGGGYHAGTVRRRS